MIITEIMQLLLLVVGDGVTHTNLITKQSQLTQKRRGLNSSKNQKIVYEYYICLKTQHHRSKWTL